MAQTDQVLGIYPEGDVAESDVTPSLPIPARAGDFSDRVSVGDPPAWVTIREVDEKSHSKTNTATPFLLFDRQDQAVTHEFYQRTVRRLDTMDAVQKSSQWSLVFDPATQIVLVHGLRVCRQGVSTEHAVPEQFRLLQREANLERLEIDGSLTLFVLLSDVRVGDVLDLSFTIRTVPRLFREKFSVCYGLPDVAELARFSFSVRLPAGHSMRWKSSDRGFEPQEREVDGATEWLWSLEDIKPIAAEQRIPSWHPPARWLQVSDFSSWAEVASPLAEAWSEQSDDEDVRKLAAEILAATADPAGQVDRAIALVQDEVRYLSMNIELGGLIPSSPGLVLRRRFGDCKDKSFLLVHLLKLLGVPARPVLVHAFLRQTVEGMLPTPSAFNHCVVEYEMAGGRRWLDATISQQGGGAQGRQSPDFGVGLAVDPSADELIRFPAAEKRLNRYTLRETFHPDTAGGTSVLKIAIEARGRHADDLRRSLANDGVEAVAKGRESFYRQLYAGLSRIGSLQWLDDRAANEIDVAESYEIPKLLVPSSRPGQLVFGIRSHVIQSMLALPGTAPRKYPLRVFLPDRIEHWISVETGTRWNIRMESISHRTDAFYFWREARRFAILFGLEASAEVVTPEKFESYSATVRKIFAETAVISSVAAGMPIAHHNRKPITITRRPRSRDASRPIVGPRTASTDAETVESGDEASTPLGMESPVVFNAGPKPALDASSLESPAPEPSSSQPARSSRRKISGVRYRLSRRQRRIRTAAIIFGILLFVTLFLMLARLSRTQ